VRAGLGIRIPTGRMAVRSRRGDLVGGGVAAMVSNQVTPTKTKLATEVRNGPARGGTTGPYPSGGGMGMDGVRAVLVGKFLKPPLTSARSPRDSSWILLISVSRFVWEGTVPSPSVVAGVCHAVHLGSDEHHTTKKDQYPQLQRRDEALGASAFLTFINMMHKAWLVRLSAGKSHPLIAFLANRLFGQRVWRGHFQGHRVAGNMFARLELDRPRNRRPQTNVIATAKATSSRLVDE
jgi:hypothetical protein